MPLLHCYPSKYVTSTSKIITMYQPGEQITCTCRKPNVTLHRILATLVLTRARHAERVKNRDMHLLL